MRNGNVETVRMEIEWHEGGACGRPFPEDEFENDQYLLIVENPGELTGIVEDGLMYSLACVRFPERSDYQVMFYTDEGDIVHWRDIRWYTYANWQLPCASDREPSGPTPSY